MHSSLVAASFITGWAPAGVSLLVKKQQQLYPQLPMSNGNFLAAEIYLSHTGGNRMQLRIGALVCTLDYYSQGGCIRYVNQ